MKREEMHVAPVLVCVYPYNNSIKN